MNIKKLDQIIELATDEYGKPYDSLFEKIVSIATEIKQSIKPVKSEKKTRNPSRNGFQE